MAPGRGVGEASADVQKEQDRLQAIVLADSFTGTFRPCSLERPKVLLPLLNVPMLDYVMEFLVASGVQEVVIFSVNKREMIQEYMSRSKWPSAVALRCISSAKCMGAGDALREIDSLGLIRSNPFILISGDVVSTVNLGAVVAAHKKRRAENSLSILTVVLAKVGYDAGIRSRSEDLVVGLSRQSHQLLLYEDDESDPHADLDLEFFKEGHKEVEVRNDLMDCHMYVCSPEVLVAFSDNWDYQDMQRYIRNEVTNREMGNRLFAHVTSRGEYAARVHDPHVYHSVSRDLMHRWLHPMVPENNNVQSGDRTSFRGHRGWRYKEDGVSVHRTAKVGHTVMLGAGTTIGERSSVSTSVLGRNVKVGKDVVIRDSHVWNDVEIEDGAVIESCILCDGVRVKSKAHTGAGSVLSFGVVIGDGVQVKPYSRIWCGLPEDPSSSSTWSQHDSTTAGGGGSDESVLGPDGHGWTFVPSQDDEHVSEEALRDQSIGARDRDECRRKRWQHLDSEEEEEEDEDDGDADGLGGLPSLLGGQSSILSVGGGGGGAPLDRQSSWSGDLSDGYFGVVVHDMVISGAASNHPVANILLEIKSFKFAQNQSFATVMQAVIPALLDLALQPDIVRLHSLEGNGGKGGQHPPPQEGDIVAKVLPQRQARDNIAAQLDHWATVLQALNQEPEVVQSILLALQTYALRDREVEPTAGSLYDVYGHVLLLLVESDLVSYEGADAWLKHAGVVGEEDPRVAALLEEKHVRLFAQWLERTMSEEEESSEEESEEGEESEEESEEEG